MIRNRVYALFTVAAVGGAWMGALQRFLHSNVIDGGGRFFT